MQENSGYVLQTLEGGWRITGRRVSLDSIVHAYWEGRSPSGDFLGSSGIRTQTVLV
jgi:hypothetical protein